MSFLIQPITIQSIFRKERSFGPITVQVVIQENANDVLTITKQPVQQGASITDHAFKEPTVFSASLWFRDNISVSLSKIYQDLLDLQVLREPFDIITPKRIYRNMLLASISMTTDQKTENVLAVNLSFQQIILVSVTTSQVPARSKQRNPGATGQTQNAGRKSGLVSLEEGFKKLTGG